MSKMTLLLSATIFLASCNQPAQNKQPATLTSHVQSDILKLLPEGTHTADIMDGFSQNPRQMELIKKLQELSNENPEWYMDYIKKIPEGEPMPYHDSLRMTRKEYSELLGYLNNPEVSSTGQEKIEIARKDNTISFNGKGRLSGYNALKIDLKNNVAIFDEYKMPFADSIDITDDRNGLRSKWKGYSWKLQEPEEINLGKVKDLHSINLKYYTLTIGKLEKNGKTYMSLKCREMESGEKKIDFELPVVF